MGKEMAQARDAANSAREGWLTAHKHKQITKTELHTGAWLITYNSPTGPKTLGPTPCNFMDSASQKILREMNLYNPAGADKHVEDNFLIDLFPKFQLTGAPAPFLAPDSEGARVHFWLYYSPCNQCVGNLKRILGNSGGYGRNTTAPWLEMTFDEYYPRFQGNPQTAYNALSNELKGAVVIRPFDPMVDHL